MGVPGVTGFGGAFRAGFHCLGQREFCPHCFANILLGWTVISWIAASVWALRSPETESFDPSQGLLDI